MVFTFRNDLIAELYKEVSGFPPADDYMEVWDELSDFEKQEEWTRLLKLYVKAIEQECQTQQDALNEFYALMNLAESRGAKTEFDQIKLVILSEMSVDEFCRGSWAVCDHFGLDHANLYVEVIEQACKELVDEHRKKNVVGS